VFKPDNDGVKRLTRKRPDLGGGFRAEPAHPAAAGAAVHRIADQRMADMGEVHADLVGAAGGELATQQRGVRAEAALRRVAGQRRLAAPVADHRHFLPVMRVAADIALDLAGRRHRQAPDHGAIIPVDAALGELPGRVARLLDERPEREMVFGARIKLLGRRVERKVARHYFGRVFATVVSLMLRLPIYDTQCGAKLFRVTPDLKTLFDTPFLSRWVFDVEIIARLTAAHGWDGPRSAENVIYEYPLTQWVDVHGSKLRAIDFVKAIYDLSRIYLAYLR